MKLEMQQKLLAGVRLWKLQQPLYMPFACVVTFLVKQVIEGLFIDCLPYRLFYLTHTI